MKEKNRLVILNEIPDDDWAYQEWKKNEIATFVIFKRVNKLLRGIRKYWIKWDLPCVFIWYSKLWKETVRQTDVVVVHMSYLTLTLPRYINKLNPKVRVIAWYWNIVDEYSLPKDIVGVCEKWSFDIEDCKKYNMNFNHQYYFRSMMKYCDSPMRDVYFCGSDCGRGKELVHLFENMSSLGLNVIFHIVHPHYDGIPQKLISSPLKYEDIISNNLNSKCILEVMRPGQVGATIRQMEALFQKRKLITNNTNIKNEDFYRPQNIFILGERPLNTLADFINAPYDHSVDKYIDSYDVFSWLNNFVQY